MNGSMASDRAEVGVRRIMMVDDEPDVTDVFKLGLSQKGFEVDAFNDPTVALPAFKPGYYDLVISDIRMPKMNGFELAYEIKKLDSSQRIVFLTAYMDLFAELKKLFERMDVLDVIEKPIGISDLANRLVQLETKRNQPSARA
jgi:DNA-binding response OmpR family regulator